MATEFDPPPQEDPNANLEFQDISRNRLEENNKKDDARKHRFRDHATAGVIVVLWIAVGLIIIGMLAYCWHLLAPTIWCWLSQDQLDKIQTCLVVAFSSVLAGYAGKQMQD